MRQPKPFFRKQTQSWYVQIAGRQINLGREEQEAWDQYHKIMAKRDSDHVPDDAVCNLLNRYLDWLKENRAEATFQRCRMHLRRFAQHIGRNRRISQLKKHHVQDWISTDYSEGSGTYQNDAISAVVTGLNWAVEMDFIDRNPIAKIRKPTRKVREFFVPASQWGELLAAIDDREFRDVVSFMLAAGARPQEARAIEARHYDQENQRIVFGREESKGKKRQRVIYLDERSQGIVDRLVERYAEGPIFRNTRGNPWTKDAFNCRFKRLKKALNMPQLCAYACRHSFAHWKLTNGHDAHVVAKLMGHVDSRMVETRYGHLEQSTEFMRAQTSDPPPLPPLGILPAVDSNTAADQLG